MTAPATPKATHRSAVTDALHLIADLHARDRVTWTGASGGMTLVRATSAEMVEDIAAGMDAAEVDERDGSTIGWLLNGVYRVTVDPEPSLIEVATALLTPDSLPDGAL